MSTSLSPRSSGSLGGSSHPTRQQLDELDALLQRMLALPVNQAEDVLAELNAPPRTTSSPRPEAVSYRTTEAAEDAAPAHDAESAPAKPRTPPRLDAAHVTPPDDIKEDAEGWVPLSSTWKPSPHTWKPLAQSWQQPRAKSPAAPAQEAPPRSEEPVEVPAAPPAPPVSVAAKTEPMAPPVPQAPPSVATPAAAEPPLPEWLRLLVWFNVAFDLLLLPWGQSGRWLRRDGPGRSFLGVAGILLLAAAVGLSVLEWFGWTCEALLDKIR